MSFKTARLVFCRAVPSAEQQVDVITISGPSLKVEAARQALLDRVSELEKEREDRALRNFALHVSMSRCAFCQREIADFLL